MKIKQLAQIGALAGLLGLSAVACTTFVSNPPAEQVVVRQSDVAIAQTVKSELMADRLLTGQSINILARDGIVALSGTVKTPRQVSRAVAITAAVPGVRAVDSSHLRSVYGERAY